MRFLKYFLFIVGILQLVQLKAAPLPPLMSGLSWEAEDGLVEGHFVVLANSIRHTKWSKDTVAVDTSKRGIASYRFKITESGEYVVKVLVKGTASSNNSFLINIDALPAVPYMICDFDSTNGFEERIVSWRGNGDEMNNDFKIKKFQLPAGEHTLYIAGREGGMEMDRITLEKVTIEDSRMVVITPDGDGNHDELLIEEKGSVKVFDKSGSIVAEFEAPVLWDMRNKKGLILSTGAYLLQINDEKPRVIHVVR